MVRVVFLIICVTISVSKPGFAEVIYSTDFDSLATGQTQSPANPAQDGWRSDFHPGASFGEIQSAIANSGNAIRQFTDISNTIGQQSIDSRSLTSMPTAGIPKLVFQVDFYASSSDLSRINAYSAMADVTGVGGTVLEFSLNGGNGQAKSTTGVSVGLAQFNGVDNNVPVPLVTGQGLAWDEWHTISVTADLLADEWSEVTVNGVSQSLTGFVLPRTFGPSGAVRPTTLEEISLQVINNDAFGDETSDSVYFDNLSLTAVPEPSGIGIGLLTASIVVSRRRRMPTE
ncbi:MAG: hypothetical protein AAF670_00315 [Planctomycetota bacterium]